jgi:hypothetical protein
VWGFQLLSFPKTRSRLKLLQLSAIVVRPNCGRIDTVDFPYLGTGHFPAMTLRTLRLLSLISAALWHRSDPALQNPVLRRQLAILDYLEVPVDAKELSCT